MRIKRKKQTDRKVKGSKSSLYVTKRTIKTAPWPSYGKLSTHQKPNKKALFLDFLGKLDA